MSGFGKESRNARSGQISYKDHLYLLSFIDIEDRLDILLLEIRNLQQTIIYLLRTPGLYLPLRYEEPYIFGKWNDLLTDKDKSDARFLMDLRCVSRAIIRYPLPNELLKEKNVTYGDSFESIYAEAKKSFGHEAHDLFEVLDGKDDFSEKIFQLRTELLKEENEAIGRKVYRDKLEWKSNWLSIHQTLEERIKGIWSGDAWARGQRRYYLSLVALQILKQQIFRDKLTLFRRSRSFALLHKESFDAAPKPAFLVLRRGLMARMESYVANIRTHKQQLDKSLGLGLQDFPRPQVDRRREIGIFQDFLSARTRDVERDMLHLLGELSKPKPSEKSVLNNLDTEMLGLHGSSPANVVSSSRVSDLVNRDSKRWRRTKEDKCSVEIKHGGNTVQHVMYMDTSFWSPDRPDLQPLIAKEAADALVSEYLDGFSSVYISDTETPLTELFVSLSREVSDFCQNPALEKTAAVQSIKKSSHPLLQVIFKDLLAVSTKGIAYLYAAFLANIGIGLERLLHTGSELRLEIVEELPKGGSAQGVREFEKQFYWYFRLRLMAFWIEKVMHLPMTHIDRIVVNGVCEVCDELVDFVDEGIPESTPGYSKVGHYWKALAVRLEKCLVTSPVLTKVEQWRKARSVDSWNEDSCTYGMKAYRRSTMRLDLRLQNYLYRRLISEKIKEGNILNRRKPSEAVFGEEIEHGIAKWYLNGAVSSEETKEARSKMPEEGNLKVETYPFPSEEMNQGREKDHYQGLRQTRYLFRHLYDIPFQSAVMRSIDLLGENGGKRWQNFIEVLHNNMTLGREIFSLALEFYTWSNESTRSRLLLSMNLIRFILQSDKKGGDQKQDGNVYSYLERWLDASSTKCFLEKIEETLTQGVDESAKNKLMIALSAVLRRPINPKESSENSELQKLAQALSEISRENLRDVCLEKLGKNEPRNVSVNLQLIGAVQAHALFAYDDANHDTCGRYERRLEQLAGYKLRELYQYLQEWSNSQDDALKPERELLAKLEPLKQFLSIHNSCKASEPKEFLQHEFYSKVLPALGDTDYFQQLAGLGDQSKDEPLSANEPLTEGQLPDHARRILVSRIAYTNYYPLVNNMVQGDGSKGDSNKTKVKDPNGYTLGEALLNAMGANQTAKEGECSIATVLGQYDAIALQKTRLTCRCKLPHFDAPEASRVQLASEQFPVHFSRREVAIPVNIWNVSVSDSEAMDELLSQPFFVVSSLSLQRREMRLNLVYRLLAVTAQFEESNEGKQSHAQDARSRSLEGDFKKLLSIDPNMKVLGLLTDGWGDCLLVFYPSDPDNVKPDFLQQFLSLQEAFSEDFMIDRSETILTPAVLDAVCKAKRGDEKAKAMDYSIQINTRLMEDRRLETTYSNHVNSLRTYSKEQRGKGRGYFNKVKTIVGRSDFSLEYAPLDDRCFYKEMVEALQKSDEKINDHFPDGTAMLDKIDTTILWEKQ